MKTNLEFVTHKIDETGTVVLVVMLTTSKGVIYSKSHQMSIQEYNRQKDWSYSLRDKWANLVQDVTYQMIIEEGLPNEKRTLK